MLCHTTRYDTARGYDTRPCHIAFGHAPDCFFLHEHAVALQVRFQFCQLITTYGRAPWPKQKDHVLRWSDESRIEHMPPTQATHTSNTKPPIGI